MKLPWTQEELDELRDTLDASIEKLERENPDLRPLPPMTVSEAKELILLLSDTATQRKLTTAEANMIGQLLCCFRMAVIAEALGKPGRHFVFSEAEIVAMMKK